MKNMLAFIVSLGLSSVVYAKVSPQLEELQKAQIQCGVVFATEVEQGKVVKQTDHYKRILTTFNQDGGDNYTDAKCFNIPAIDQNGQATTISGSCLVLDETRVKEFSTNNLVIKDKSLNRVLRINFKTGEGSFSLKYRGCDWGRECVSKSAEAHFTGCFIK